MKRLGAQTLGLELIGVTLEWFVCWPQILPPSSAGNERMSSAHISQSFNKVSSVHGRRIAKQEKKSRPRENIFSLTRKTALLPRATRPLGPSEVCMSMGVRVEACSRMKRQLDDEYEEAGILHVHHVWFRGSNASNSGYQT